MSNKKMVTSMSLLATAVIATVLLAKSPQPMYQAHLPMVGNLGVGCPECDRGSAWGSGGCSVATSHTEVLVAAYYFNSGSYACTDATSMAIPLVRCDTCVNTTLSEVLAVLPHDYDGWLMVCNECDRPDQDDLTPSEAVSLTLRVAAEWPNAKLVGPNMSHDLSNIWLVQFFELLPPDVLDVYSFHIYGDRFTAVSDRVDLFCDKIELAGKACDRPIWITEMGYHGSRPQPTATMRRWAIEARADERVAVTFAFIDWHEADPVWNLLTKPGLIPTLAGQGWIEAATLPPQPASINDEAYP